MKRFIFILSLVVSMTAFNFSYAQYGGGTFVSHPSTVPQTIKGTSSSSGTGSGSSMSGKTVTPKHSVKLDKAQKQQIKAQHKAERIGG
jgi:hypothetical protein